jgi:hypothetical protein
MDARKLAFLLTFTVLSGCASAGHDGDGTRRKQQNMITREDLVDNKFQNAHEAIAALRSNWLQPRGPDSFRTPSKVWVYLDSNKLGGVESLNSIDVTTVSYIQHFNGTDATTWWGVGHSAGVIYISTHPVVTQSSLR